jgi:hypothetical protein
MNKIIQKWRLTRHGSFSISRIFNIDAMISVDNQILLAKSGDYIKYSEYSLNNITAEFSMKIDAGNVRNSKGVPVINYVPCYDICG